MRTIILAGSLCMIALGSCFAQTAVTVTTHVETRIAPQPLADALKQFAKIHHIQVLYLTADVRNLRTLGASGDLTADEALSHLLSGTGLKYRYVDSNAVSIVPAEPATGKARSTSSGPKRQSQSPGTHEMTSSQTPKRTDPPDVPKKKGEHAVSNYKSAALQEVIVTGTHIRGAPVSSPVTRITREEIDRSGYTTAGALIQSLPDNFGNSGPQTGIGAAPNANGSLSGAPAPNLYGLGATSTLTLVDGQRLAADSASGAVDISLIPLPVIDHIDVLSGGASAIYGSDAVAGVVNFVLVKEFDGSKTTLIGGGTADGGGTERDVNEMLGKTWSGGGVILDYESYVQDPILASQRDYTRTAATPLTTTLPGTSRGSFFASAHQNLGEAVSAFVTGLYTHRSLPTAYSYSPTFPTLTTHTDVHQYAADGGLNVILPFEWSLSVVGDYSEERTLLGTTVLTASHLTLPTDSNEGVTKSLEVTANGPILAIWSGDVRGAAGVGGRRETYNFGEGNVSISPGAHRTVRYAYGELNAPLITQSNITWRRELALDLSGRFERYSDFGDESVPKIGLVYAPFSTIHVRATWGRAFRAPSLDQLDNIQEILYGPMSDPLSATGISDVLERGGGNPRLTPEKARTWTLGIDYESAAIEGLRASVTYFDIAYRDRIGSISDESNALLDPLDEPFVTRDPSEGLVQSLLTAAGPNVFNEVGGPISASTVSAIINGSDVNIASQNVVGGDVDVRYRGRVGLGEIEPFMDAALLDLGQRLVPGAPKVEISGLVFEPAKVRARTGVSWFIKSWSMTGIVNYNGSEVDTYQPNDPRVSSWTTIDFNLAWQRERGGVFGGLKLNLAVENAFNRDPPVVRIDEFLPGIHYDSLNANVLGRVIRVGATWLF